MGRILSALTPILGISFRLLSRLAWLTVPVGCLGVAIYNWRQWQQDKQLLARKSDYAPLPRLDEYPTLPKVSVLVAAWNEAENIDRHILSFLELRYPVKELILCAGGTDGTYLRAAHWAGPQVTVIEQQPGEGKQRALRRCLARAQGDLIFFTDADCRLDDVAFERVIYPLVDGAEEACSGGARPFPSLMDNPFVVSQAASQLYSTMHAPRYSAGLLGRNCAVTRKLLESSGGLDAPAPTGTDYVLAKMLVAAGGRIRQIPESRVATAYPTTTSTYLRQQRRWLRNVALHGRRFDCPSEVRASLVTSCVGLAMLAIPLFGLMTRIRATLIWFVILEHVFLSRLRYLFFARTIIGTRVTARQLAATVPLLILDFVAWVLPLVDYAFPSGRGKW